jgi:protein-tyrosine-phosphatase
MSPSASERRVLFVCTHNAGRSIVAAALLNAHQPPGVRADSAGTDPSDALNPTVATALAERGISLAGVYPKPITTELLATAELVVTMSRQASGPTLPPGAGGNSTGSSTSQAMTWWRCGPSATRSTSRSRHSWATLGGPRADLQSRPPTTARIPGRRAAADRNAAPGCLTWAVTSPKPNVHGDLVTCSFDVTQEFPGEGTFHLFGSATGFFTPAS